MIESLRPDTTDEGWNTWPTEQVSHTLSRDPFWSELIQSHVENELADKSADAASMTVALIIRKLTEGIVSTGEADELRTNLLTFALSRVDWFQLAQSRIADAVPEEPIDNVSSSY